ncbi:MAG: methylated-DNA--[protein]-cysteine S-methyltransferase [Dehalococcoidia bacterium]
MPIRVMVDEAATPYGPIYLAATERGLCRVTIPGETYDDLLSWLERKLRTADIAREPGALAEAARPVVAFLEAGEPIPALSLDMSGTPFQRAVWEAVLEIPYGETRSYVEIARTIGHPLAPRAVGAANAINPLPFVVPCHRVVGADGTIKGYPGGIVNRAMLLRLEGWFPT